MEKRASNTFVGGLNTDKHPLTSQNTELIEARNIDLVQIGEGYQLILQKREGNLEVIAIPPAYISTKTYFAGEYVMFNGVIYKSLQDVNVGHAPDLSAVWWTIHVGTSVPAGLKEGFIPLAVKEFNNIAYIISVKPNVNGSLPGIGEIGTFPSPNYDLFTFNEGAAIPGGAVVGLGVYDPYAEPTEFGVDLELDPQTGTEELLLSDSSLDHILLKSGGTIYQTGYTPNSYTIELSDDWSGNLIIEVSMNGGAWADYNPLILPTTTNYGIPTQDYISIRVKVADPAQVPAVFDLPITRTVTITPQAGGPVVSYDFIVKVNTEMFIRLNGTLVWSNLVDTIGVPVGGASYHYDLWLNNPANIVEIGFFYSEVWLEEDPLDPYVYPDYYLKVGANGSGLGRGGWVDIADLDGHSVRIQITQD